VDTAISGGMNVGGHSRYRRLHEGNGKSCCFPTVRRLSGNVVLWPNFPVRAMQVLHSALLKGNLLVFSCGLRLPSGDAAIDVYGNVE
jgi:hypothetical protein